MFKRILKMIGAVIAAIIILSITNDLLTYRIDREAGVDFGKYHEYSGVVHVHTQYSDGSDSYQQIGRMCDSLGIHFAIITDYNTVQPMIDNLAGRFGMSLIVPAVEISTNGKHGHFLVIGDSIPLVPQGGVTSDSVFHDALAKESMVIPTHMFHPRGTLDWDNWNTENFTGIELYNFDESWRNSLTFFGINKVIGAYVAYGFQEEALNYLLEYPGEEMKKFDELNMSRKVVGIGSLDARSNVKFGKNFYWHFPSYQSLFDLVQTVIVTKEQFNGLYHHDRELLLNAVRKGNMFVSFCGLEQARGFLFTATSDTDEVVMGDSLKVEKSAHLHIVMPDSSGVETQIVWNGKIIASYDNASSIDFPVMHPGEYRVQAFQKRVMLPLFMKRSFPWILSNPIYIYR
ncbi:MAG: hypothetical protein WAO19_01450 [Candidatus Kryptoniota bacterium]